MKNKNIYFIVAVCFFYTLITNSCKKEYDTCVITPRNELGELTGAEDPEDWQLHTNMPQKLKNMFFSKEEGSAAPLNCSAYKLDSPLPANVRIRVFPNPVPINGNIKIGIENFEYTPDSLHIPGSSDYYIADVFYEYESGLMGWGNYQYRIGRECFITSDMMSLNNKDSRLYIALFDRYGSIFYTYGDVQVEK